MLRRTAQRAEPFEIGTLQHSFFIDIRTEKSGAIRFELANHFRGGECGGFLPAFHNYASLFTVKRDDHAFRTNGASNFLEESGNQESCRSHDDAIGALLQELSSALH